MKQIFSNSLIYAIGNAANSAAWLLIIPYLINALTPTEYGAWSLFEIAIFLFNMLILAGLEVGLMREYWSQADEQRRARLAGSALIMASAIGATIVTSGAVIVLGGVDFNLPGAPHTLLLVLTIGWSEAIFAVFLTLFRIREQPIWFIILSVGRMALFAALAAGLVEGGFGLTGALGARLIATIALIGGGLIAGWRWIAWQADQALIGRMVSYGLPLLPTNLAAYVLFAADRYIMQGFLSLEDIATYTFAYKIATVLDVLITRPFALDWAPRRFKIATQQHPEQRYAHALLVYLWAALGCALAIIALTPLLYSLIAPPAYWPAMDVVPVILLAYIVYGLSYPLNVGIMLKDHTRDLPVIGWIAALCCLGLCFWWIPVFGITGAAWATVAAYAVWTGLVALDSQRLYPIAYPWALIGSMVGIGGIVYGGLWFSAQWWPAAEPVAAAMRLGWVIVLMGGCGLWLWRYMHRHQAPLFDSPAAGD
ncbi:lipopolysaccharide biosynthesis protein [Chloroflexus sp.]|uniref:lipopolysaccharide biosynthesis protein n=1 Tax=Chloroflexus sp. TaxID=1904827 RepID=UPI002ACE6C53|nr:oligosaccharide flippase family protein [Chloroflexus sp.]